MKGRMEYANIALSLVPRILSSLDRNRHSSTFGCFDKPYWYYKSTDFPCARLQEPMLTLALLYKNRFDNNVYFGKEKLLEWAIAGIDFLSKSQNRDGSFNEWYPNERSFCGTTFPVYSASETFKVLNRDITGRKRDGFLDAFEKSGRWLMRHRESVANQEAGSIASLYNIYQVTGNEQFRKHAEKKLMELGKSMSKEGWFSEYGGADMGYLTVVLDFLGKYYKGSKNRAVLEIVKPTMEFLKYFIHPNGSLGGVYGSRNTELKLPHGLEIFSRENSNAKYIADRIAENINNTLNPLMMDDRYAYLYHISYLQAFLDYLPGKPSNVRMDRVKEFPEAGLFVHNKRYYIVINMKKGGVFRLFRGDKHVYDDSGFVAKRKGKILTSQWGSSSKYNIENMGNKIRINITGNFKELYSRQNMTPFRNIVFRSAVSTVGKSQKTSLCVKRLLRGRLITKAKDTQILYKRVIELERDSIRVTDRLEKPRGLKLDGLFLTSKFRSSYVPTAGFYQETDLENQNKPWLFKNHADDFEGEIEIKRTIPCR